jgi:hypothetical protein
MFTTLEFPGEKPLGPCQQGTNAPRSNSDYRPRPKQRPTAVSQLKSLVSLAESPVEHALLYEFSTNFRDAHRNRGQLRDEA